MDNQLPRLGYRGRYPTLARSKQLAYTMGLGSHRNVWNTCLLILRKQGFALRLEAQLDDEEMIVPESCLWYAEKNGFSMYADNPIELLGLAAIHTDIQPTTDISYWWKLDGPDDPDIVDELYDTIS